MFSFQKASELLCGTAGCCGIDSSVRDVIEAAWRFPGIDPTLAEAICLTRSPGSGGWPSALQGGSRRLEFLFSIVVFRDFTYMGCYFFLSALSSRKDIYLL